MKKIFVTLVILLPGIALFSQSRVFTKGGKISFLSKTSVENIEASNRAVVSVLDKTSGQLEFSVLMKGFEFEKALMQEHFNENYVESDKYPKAVFKGKIDDISKINFGKDGKYTANATGLLTMHGETKTVSAPASFMVQNGKLSSSAEFTVALSDYKIPIPAVVKDNIATTVKILVSCNYEPMN